jgi:ADP-ribose pyrophosphatase YjhB (NUDIX family)
MKRLNGSMKRSVAVSLVCSLTGCGEAAPPCADKTRFIAADSAGCLVSGERGILLVRDWNGRLALPGGSVEREESAHCGAEREVFEETGLAVVVGPLATIFDNGFHLFWCHADPAVEPEILRPLEIKEVGWWQPERVPTVEWRYPGQGAAIRELVAEGAATVRSNERRAVSK